MSFAFSAVNPESYSTFFKKEKERFAFFKLNWISQRNLFSVL